LTATYIFALQEQDKKLKKYHHRLVSLLATCAQGNNRYIESLCQTILGLDEVLEVLSSTHIPHDEKATYLQLVLLAK
jgi:hypothetical protein